MAEGGESAADPFVLAGAAAEELARRTGRARHDAVIVLGSGWQEAVAGLGENAVELETRELPGFAPPSVAGHHGTIRSVEVGGRAVLCCIGRVHLYEGRTPAEVVHPVRTAVMAGATTVLLTNAAGGIRPGFRPGQAVLIADHLNLTGASPLSGPPPPAGMHGRFVDLSCVYDAGLRSLAREAAVGIGDLAGEAAARAGEAREADAAREARATGAAGERVPAGTLAQGVYAGLLGPHYETPAEVAMLSGLGADLVGMSTVLEAIAARHLGASVLGISLVTNFAAGVSPTPLDHAEVLAAGQAAAPALGRLLAAITARLPAAR